MNGVPILHKQDEIEAAIRSMRLDIAKEVIGSMAAIDFQRSIQSAKEAKAAEMEFSGNGEYGGDLQIKLNPQLAANAATAYADALLVHLGYLNEAAGG